MTELTGGRVRLSASERLSELERWVEATNYSITVNGKADGSVEVVLTHKVHKHKWVGVSSRHSSFPYQTALEQANMRMQQYENRFSQ